MKDILFLAFNDFDVRKQKEQFLAEELSKYYRIIFVQRALRLLFPSKDYEKFYLNYKYKKYKERENRLIKINSNLFLYTPPIDLFPFTKISFISEVYYFLIYRELKNVFRLLSPPFAPSILYLNHPRLIHFAKMFSNKFVILDKCGVWSSYYGGRNFGVLSKYLEKRAEDDTKLALSRSNLVISSSMTFIEELPDQFKKKCIYLPPGIDNKFLEKSNSNELVFKKVDNKVVVGSVCGRYTKNIVNVEYLRFVIEKFKDFQFTFVGAHIEELGIEEFPNVRFVGEVPHCQLSNYLETFDVALIPYNSILSTNQGLPTKLSEYWAFGLPVVSTNFSPELLINPDIRNNIFISNSKEEFAENIIKAVNLGKNKSRYEKLIEFYKWENIGKSLFELIERLVR